MTIAKDVQNIHSEIREYLARMAELKREPSAVYLTSKQIEKLEKQAKRDGVEFHPVIDGYPIKVWNP